MMNVTEFLMYDLMIDIETLGKQDNAVITSIAARQFNVQTGKLGESFIIHIDIDDSLKHGRVVQGDTIQWWLQQSDHARSLIYDEDMPRHGLRSAMMQFGNWIYNLSLVGEVRPWGNGASFDLTKIKNSMAAVDITVPWQFFNERDVRTLSALRPEFKEAIEFVGTKHHPLDDCDHQIKYCTAAYRALNTTITNKL